MILGDASELCFVFKGAVGVGKGYKFCVNAIHWLEQVACRVCFLDRYMSSAALLLLRVLVRVGYCASTSRDGRRTKDDCLVPSSYPACMHFKLFSGRYW